MMDIAIFLLNNAASYLKESSVDKLYVSIFAICNSEEIYAANSLSHLIKKSREQWKLGNIRLHMAKINTYDFLRIHTHLYILV